MSVFVYRQHNTLITSAGTANFTVPIQQSILENILIKPASSSTSFDVKIVDADDFEILHYYDFTGLLNLEIHQLIDGNFTVTIENASADEAFSYKLKFYEGAT